MPHLLKLMSHKMNKSGLFNRASPNKIFRVCKGFNDEQRKVIVNADLGDVLHWKCSKLIPDLCKYLMGCFRPDTCQLDFGSRGRIPTDLQSVVSVLGVPMGNNPFSYCLDAGATRTMLDMFGIKDGKQPSLAFLEKQLGPNHPADDIFPRKFCIYLTCSVFAPTTAIGISPRCYPSLVDTEGIRNLNWPKFIIDIMIQTSRAKSTKSWFKACMPYLMIRYVDSLDLDGIEGADGIEVPEGTRICAWTNKMVRLAVELDTNSDVSFGRLPLKQCFRIMMTLFSAEPSVLDMFIKTHAPGDHTEDDLVKYREAIKDMCNDFEDGLAKFIKNLPSTSKPQAHEEEQFKVPQQSTIARERTSKRIRETTEKSNSGEGFEAAGMGAKTTTDEARGMQKDSRKRKPDVATYRTVGGKMKKPKPNQNVQAEPAESNEEEAQQNLVDKKGEHKPVEMVCPHDRDLFEVDMEIATGQAAGKHIKNKNYTECSDSARVFSDTHVFPVAEALKHLQIYGSGSQSSAGSIPEAMTSKISADGTGDGRNFQQQQFESATKEPVVQNDKEAVEVTIKPVAPNFSPRNTERSPSVQRRPVTRSMSPLSPTSPPNKETTEVNWDVGTSGCKSSSPRRRQTRIGTEKVRASTLLSNHPPGTGVDHHGLAAPSITSRKLEQDFCSTELLQETEQQRRQRQLRELIDDCPTFDLGFDDSLVEAVTVQQGLSCTNLTGIVHEAVVSDQHPTEKEEEPIVISSNEASVDSLDEIYSKVPMPAATPVNTKLKENTSPPSALNSYTPVPQAHQKRVVKIAPAQKSPFMQAKKQTASKPTCDVYNKVCTFGGRSTDTKKDKKIIHVGPWFIYLHDLANSIKPNGWLSNSTCETALYILSKELASQKKCVMPLSIGTKLSSPTFIEDRALQKCFEFSSKNRLDHKELIMFPRLQNVTPKSKNFTGHYYLITLNLKAERFEVMDSMRSVGTPSLASDSSAIIDAIKQLWAVNYLESNVDISSFQTVFIATPMQKTLHDYGYFMLKYIEYWDGRRLTNPFTHADMPIIRKLMMKKWLEWEENRIAWNDLLFLPLGEH